MVTSKVVASEIDESSSLVAGAPASATFFVFRNFGAEGRDRTGDLWFTIPLLCQLSYLGEFFALQHPSILVLCFQPIIWYSSSAA